MSRQFFVSGYVTLDDSDCDGDQPNVDAYTMVRNMHVGDLDDVDVQWASD